MILECHKKCQLQLQLEFQPKWHAFNLFYQKHATQRIMFVAIRVVKYCGEKSWMLIDLCCVVLTITIDLHGTDPFYGKEEKLPFLPLPSYSPPIFHHLSIILFEIIKKTDTIIRFLMQEGEIISFFNDLKKCCVWFLKSKSIQIFRPKSFKMAMIYWCTNMFTNPYSVTRKISYNSPLTILHAYPQASSGKGN